MLTARMSAPVVIPLEPRPAPVPATPEVKPGAFHAPELDTIATCWQLALDAADHALAAAHGPVHIHDADGKRRELGAGAPRDG